MRHTLVLLSMAAFAASLPAVAHAADAPNGSYKKTCVIDSFRNPVLTAHCQPENGPTLEPPRLMSGPAVVQRYLIAMAAFNVTRRKAGAAAAPSRAEVISIPARTSLSPAIRKAFPRSAKMAVETIAELNSLPAVADLVAGSTTTMATSSAATDSIRQFGRRARAGTATVTDPIAFEPRSKTAKRTLVTSAATLRSCWMAMPSCKALSRFCWLRCKSRGVRGPMIGWEFGANPNDG